MNHYELPKRSNQYEVYMKFVASLSVENNALHEIWNQLGNFGLIATLIPEDDYFDPRVMNDVLIGMGEGCRDTSLILALAANCFAVAAPISRFGTEKQKKLWLSRLRSGEFIGAFAATEANAGSDIMSLTTTYKETEDNYVINGEKCFITNAYDADFFLVLATRNNKLYERGLSAFIVPADTSGITIGKEENRKAFNNSSLASVYFDDVTIPKDHILGKKSYGAYVFRHALLWERALIFIPQIGLMRAELENCISYANTREQFGGAIGKNQFVVDKIITIYSYYITSKLLATDVINKLSKNKLSSTEASFIKLYISEAILRCHEAALRIHGANGILNETGIIDKINDALGGVILSGTSDIQKVIIANGLGIRV